jgi:hypothetical protein
MIISKQNNKIEISEKGFNLEIKADLLLNTLISESTKNTLEIMMKHKLNELKKHFEEIDTIIKLYSNKLNFYKENRNSYIYEYTCLIRDLGSLLSDTFENFNYDNEFLIENINNIYKYSRIYGFKPQEEVKI